jgi:hypothetical protein
VTLPTQIILWPKNLEARHFLVNFGPNCETEAKEERIYKSVTKAYCPGNNITRRQLKRATEYNKALENTLPEVMGPGSRTRATYR